MSKYKGNDDMVRIIAVAAAFLAMCIIIGISVHSIDKIDKSNQIVKDIEAGKQFASSIVQTEQTTNLWEYLRNTTAPATETTVEESLETQESGAESVNSQEGVIPIITETTFPVNTESEQTTAVTTKSSSTGFILHLD